MNIDIDKSKIKKYKYLLVEVVLILVVVSVILWWQNRGTLPADGQLAPDFRLLALDGSEHHLQNYRGKPVLVYFFAPWCSVCHWSADNVNDLRAAREQNDLVILMVALSYQDPAEVEAFAAKLKLEVPVLLGTDQLMLDYQIQGFPTYYVVDEGGHLVAKSMGYSTELGMRLRT